MMTPIEKIIANGNNPLTRILGDISSLPQEEKLLFISNLVQHEEADTRVRGLLAARLINHPRLSQFCVHSLNDPIWYVRRLACEFVFDFMINEAAPKILSLLENEENDETKAAAATTIGKIAGPEMLPKLFNLVQTISGQDYEGTSIQRILLHSIAEIQSRERQQEV